MDKGKDSTPGDKLKDYIVRSPLIWNRCQLVQAKTDYFHLELDRKNIEENEITTLTLLMHGEIPFDLPREDMEFISRVSDCYNNMHLLLSRFDFFNMLAKTTFVPYMKEYLEKGIKYIRDNYVMIKSLIRPSKEVIPLKKKLLLNKDIKKLQSLSNETFYLSNIICITFLNRIRGIKAKKEYIYDCIKIVIECWYIGCKIVEICYKIMSERFFHNSLNFNRVFHEYRNEILEKCIDITLERVKEINATIKRLETEEPIKLLIMVDEFICWTKKRLKLASSGKKKFPPLIITGSLDNILSLISSIEILSEYTASAWPMPPDKLLDIFRKIFIS